jgi:hypothetical protein
LLKNHSLQLFVYTVETVLGLTRKIFYNWHFHAEQVVPNSNDKWMFRWRNASDATWELHCHSSWEARSYSSCSMHFQG